MQTDFKIHRDIYLTKDELTLDLDNDFDFQEVNYSVAARSVSLHWKRSARENIKSNLPSSIRLDFFEVSEFRFNPRNSGLLFTEDDCLDAIGYWTDEDWCDGVFLSATGQVLDPNYLMAFEFMSGATILLRAQQAALLIEP